jgi:hypothetical protein
MRRLLTGLAAVTLVLGGVAGCVERTLFIRSDPPGGRVFLDGEPQGLTPARIAFTHYGTREIVVRAPGRKPARIIVDVTAPWWQLTPIDFVTELLIPWTIEDERAIDARLDPAAEVAPGEADALLKRAEERRTGP